MKTNKLGFSLIELSIVILIIGVLVIGITKGSRIINASRSTSAQNLTVSSPVNLHIDNVGLWLDASSEKSFDAVEAKNGSTITNWYDVKSSLVDVKNVAVNFQATSSSKPLYISSAVNGLPSIRFDGVDDSMFNNNVNSNSLSHGGNQITMFLVEKYITPDHDSAVFGWENSSVWERVLLLPLYGGSLRFDFGPCCPVGSFYTYTPPATFKNKTHIITLTHRPNSTGFIKVNGTKYNPVSGLTSTITPGANGTLTIGNGGGESLRGEINELIIIKTALTDAEISEIEVYLSKKWGIALKGL